MVAEGGDLITTPTAASRRRLHVAQADVQLAKLFFVHRAGRLGKQALRALRLGKGDHVANRFGAG